MEEQEATSKLQLWHYSLDSLSSNLYPILKVFTRFRFAAALFVILTIAAAPALTCLSFIPQMDMQQMACCKQMADDCDMGAGNQSCCGHARAQTVRAALPDKPLPIEPAIIGFHVAAEITPRPQIFEHNFIHADDGSPPLEPPGSITVLRI